MADPKKPAPAPRNPAPSGEAVKQPASPTGLVVTEQAGGELAIGGAISPAAASFLSTVKGKQPDPTRIPLIEIDHQTATWVLPGGEVAEAIEGYAVFYFQTRRWYRDRYDPSQKGRAPDCMSADMITPHPSSPDPQGGPQGKCLGCPMAQFGSADTGRGQACAVFTTVFLINSEFGSPPCGYFMAPPSSMAALLGSRFKGGHFARCKQRAGAFQLARSRFHLSRPAPKSPHCVIVPEVVGVMEEPRHAQALARMFNFLRSSMDNMRGEPSDFSLPDVPEAEVVPPATPPAA